MTSKPANMSAGDCCEPKASPTASDLALDESVLRRLATPFTWAYDVTTRPLKSRAEVVAALEKKLVDTDIDDDDVHDWHVLCLQLTLCYETWKGGDHAGAMHKLGECERLLASAADRADDFLGSHHDAVEHVLASSRYCLVQGEAERAEIFDTLQPIEEWSDRKAAGASGLRAAVAMQYGYLGTTDALQHVRTAIRLDPDSAEWHFAYGKCLGRRRHVERTFEVLAFNVDELKALETAVELSDNPYYMVFLAQAYREAALCLAQERDAVVEAHVRQMNDRAAQLYMRVLELRPDCPFISVRCAQGFMRFEESHRDMGLAHACAWKALQLEPDNVMVNHVWGQVNVRLGRIPEAVAALSKAQHAYGASIDLVKLKARHCQPYDPLTDLARMRVMFLEPPYQAATMAQEASYWYFVRREAARAVQLLMRVVRLDPLSERLREHVPDVFVQRWRRVRSVNLYLVLLKELPRLAAAAAAPDEAARLRADLAEVRSICARAYPDLLRGDAMRALLAIEPKDPHHATLRAPRTTHAPPSPDRHTSRSDSDRDWRRNERAPVTWDRPPAAANWRQQRPASTPTPAPSWRREKAADEKRTPPPPPTHMPFAREGGGDGPPGR